jgi:hypothetical protein
MRRRGLAVPGLRRQALPGAAFAQAVQHGVGQGKGAVAHAQLDVRLDRGTVEVRAAGDGQVQLLGQAQVLPGLVRRVLGIEAFQAVQAQVLEPAYLLFQDPAGGAQGKGMGQDGAGSLRLERGQACSGVNWSLGT